MSTFGKSLSVRVALVVAMLIPSAALAQEAASAKAVTVEQIISREDPSFNCTGAIMNVGRDGNVYLGWTAQPSYIIRLSADGKAKSASASPSAMSNVTANADGVVAGAHAHFTASIYLYDTNLQVTDRVPGFLVNDAVGWDASAHVDVGASGDFYGMDQHRDRVLRITPLAKTVKEIPLGTDPENKGRSMGQMHRVCEKTESLYVLDRAGHIRCMSFDGKKKWEIEAGINPYAHGGGNGGFDVDDDGTLYVIKGHETAVRMYDTNGQPAGEITLNMGDNGPVHNGPRIAAMSVRGGEIFIRRVHPTEAFQRYDKASGNLKNIVYFEHERLSMSYPSEVWTAGQAVDFTIAFDSGGQVIKPNWKVWARNFGDTNWRELSWKDNKLQVPADLVGVVHVKVSPELQPAVRGLQSEYLVQSLVAVVKPDTVGTAVVATENNRLWYGRGEAIAMKVYLSTRGVDLATGKAGVSVRLVNADGKTLASGKGEVAADMGTGLDFLLPAGLTSALAPGRYRVEVACEGVKLTCVGKSIEIGPGMSPVVFRTIRYGDYGLVFPTDHGQSIFDGTDSTANYLAYLNKLGINFLSDRLGWSGNWGYFSRANHSEMVAAMAGRLNNAGVMPAAAFGFQPQYLQLMSGYSAYGVEQMPVLLYMDASLPFGHPYDGRTEEKASADLQHVTKALAPYPAFTGWIFGNNWWVFNQRGASGARNNDATLENPDGTINRAEYDAYVAAEREAKASGKWNPVLDKVSQHRWTLLPNAAEMLRGKMNEIIPGKLASAGGPYRNMEHYPPVSHAKLDVVDMQAQFEQIDVPYHAPHAVDYMRRPGKPALSHPEVWNDDGTGGQILSTLFMVAMRGSDSVGFSGNIPNWGTQPEDNRLADTGMASVYRSIFGAMRTYGPWLVTLNNNDRVAIIVERRMLAIDSWDYEMPRHFTRLHEAYVSCLHAHHPASYVFAEEANAETLKPFKVLLLVDQQVELEPKLMATLEAAQKAGATIFYDKTCRESMMPKGAKPLDVAFDKFSSKGHQAGDDAAYHRFPAWAKENVPALAKALSTATAPVATTDNPEVLMSERASGGGRYLWVVNNTTPDMDPGVIWRATLIQTSRIPVVAKVKLNQPTGAIYDVFAGKRVEIKDGAVDADLRTLPARLYAMLEAPITMVAVSPSAKVQASGMFNWQVWVMGAKAGEDPTISASVPVRVRLLAAGGKVVDERIVAAAGKDGGTGTFVAPADAAALYVEATELFSGKSIVIPVEVTAAPAGVLSSKDEWKSPEFAAKKFDEWIVQSGGKMPATPFVPVEQSFGPHVRNMVVSADGKTVLMNAMNWDENLYAVNVADGKAVWSKKVGHYFAFAPQAFGGGFVAQGYDLTSAQGYHLYTMDAAGKVDKRFALYGLPRRLPHRFVPNMLGDRINNFASAADGSWVAAAGDMGLAVWARDGKVLFQQDWHKTGRHTARLAAIDNKTLLVVEDLTATAYNTADGKGVWQVPNMFPNGEVRSVVVSRDGKTVALLATCQGGRIFLLRDGKLLRAIPTPSEEADLTADGSMLAVVVGNQLKLYSVAEGLKWIYSGEGPMRLPRFARDGKRIAATGDLATAYVFDLGGAILMERDTGAKAVPAWLDNGDLILATWMGTVMRLDGKYNVTWQQRLQPATSDIITRQLAEDKTPTVSVGGWTNNLEKPLATDAANNLLAQTKPYILFVPSGGWGGWAKLQHNGALFYDGKMDPPPTPWLDWSNIGFFAETSPINYLLIDAYRVNMKVSAITLVEDKNRPESWLRDASLEYWDAADELWKPAVELLSDAAVHSHQLPQPITAARWRIMMPWGLVGNLRLGQIVFHGELVGGSHPDVAAKRPVAVLFDEGNDLADCMAYRNSGFTFDLKAAMSGNRSIRIEANKSVSPIYNERFGHDIPNWDFEIAENPADGQYRYAQFAWKAGDEKTKGVSITFVAADNKSVTFHAAETKAELGAKEKVADSVPADWTVVRVDLWKHFGGPVRIQSMTLGAVGGPGYFDQILLGKTEEALPKK
ncbi:MAG: PQQ-binding-like beta-propeller repeat protein [Phycisphaerae bacterium]|nr:PQQ-binding-like beta-propeller repeat protein [Phycisphaerae bacterium]